MIRISYCVRSVNDPRFTIAVQSRKYIEFFNRYTQFQILPRIRQRLKLFVGVFISRTSVSANLNLPKSAQLA